MFYTKFGWNWRSDSGEDEDSFMVYDNGNDNNDAGDDRQRTYFN